MKHAMKLTEAQRSALRFASDARSRWYDDNGVHPRRGQHQMFEILRLRGLLKHVGERQIHLYRITAAGVRALARPKAA